MRHGIVLLFCLLGLAIAWRVAAVFAAGDAMHQREVAARHLAAAIVRAEFERAGPAPAADSPRSYAFLSTLVAEGRLNGLTAVAGGERELYRAGGYFFHVRLLNPLRRPILRPPTDAASEPGLGLDFELWAWPAERHETTLALFFGSDAGLLAQGDNGRFAGARARPEEVSPSPTRLLEDDPDGAGSRWIVVEQVRAP